MIIYQQTTRDVLVEFDSYIESSFHLANSVAYEPLENGSFSNDSKQNAPFILSVTGIKVINTNPNKLVKTVDQVKQALQELSTSSTLVYLLLQPQLEKSKSSNSQYYQYGSTYENMSLVSIDYQNSIDQIEFRPTMIFQQIRLTDTEYTQSQNTANPENSSTQNQGQKQPAPFNFLNYLQNFSIINSVIGG